MSGLEVAALVCGIISAFSGAAALVKKRKEKKTKEALMLQRSLELGPLRVQGEYDRDFERLGRQFAEGDDITSHQLKDIVIQMQAQMITTLHIMLAGGPQDFDGLLGISENSRTRTVSALAEQFQRMSVAAPIQKNPQPTLERRSGLLAPQVSSSDAGKESGMEVKYPAFPPLGYLSKPKPKPMPWRPRAERCSPTGKFVTTPLSPEQH